MQGFLALSNLFSQISCFPEDRASVHQLILDTVISIVGRTKTGFLGTNEGEDWVLTASRVSQASEIDIIGLAENFLAGAPIKITDKTLCGGMRTDQGVKIVMRIDTGAGEVLSDEDKSLFKVSLDLVGAYETLVETRRETKNAQETIKQILDLVSGLRESERDSDSFFLELLQSALSVVDEADYGSVALMDRGQWRFVAAVGHDWERLRQLNIPSDAFGSFSSVAVIDDVLSREDILSPWAMVEIRTCSRPISRSMIVGLDVGPDHRVNLSLDIRKGSRKKFSEGSKLAIDRFVKLASSFLRLRLQREFVEHSYRNFTDKLAILAEAHDKNTALHNVRVSVLSGFLAEKMGLNPSEVQGIRQGAMVHDIGKLFLSSELLNKKGPLTDDERTRLSQHTLLAEKLLDDPYFALDQKIAVYHHERYDGKGYPRGLKGEEIPIEAQIVSTADVYDALRNTRSYKVGFPPQDALSRMRHGDERLDAGGFNPEILSILEENWETVEQLWERMVPVP